MKKVIKRLCILKKINLILFFCLWIGDVHADQELSLFPAIKSQFSKYREIIQTQDVQIINGVLQIKLNGRRTNIETQMFIGFFSIGKVLWNRNYPIREVRIIVRYTQKISHFESLTAPADLVISLAQGHMNSEQFFTILEH